MGSFRSIILMKYCYWNRALVQLIVADELQLLNVEFPDALPLPNTKQSLT